MTEAVADLQRLTGYTLLCMGFMLLIINHVSIVLGDPWLIPEFLKLQ
ncbi:MAG: hypothetical protein KUF77_19705 [Candidatus Thiodiazotropha sp. (ex Lucina aurantia)]|uniref:Uncharacterized protein n=2 Tax=Candidatus Thiodiazotropha TaxID=1913444 RepID=A0A7Z0VNN5_9GAMM|nr:hypothetical protein [Candidatus Thiodiazotropha endolucinida]MBT3013836.1 hypothetical protein [Candidatus Thiodiazotropha sp. (ex Lucina pensylvanica)]MBT3016962.1 hypothetical protein [Candidatus Thiodiazotropha taylori]MBT3043886.1 hypothetical protein [Candidatus Thiodiazotropha sp. (ex Codakia orbicularis)]MBV2105258.1 hypothetical protein [Candidatus Thiodiazotropha sp. (ex Lucina aurantia)]MBT3025415.1 hypothetical protein [Candidatus Thiodiazotropha taylori]